MSSFLNFSSLPMVGWFSILAFSLVIGFTNFFPLSYFTGIIHIINGLCVWHLGRIINKKNTSKELKGSQVHTFLFFDLDSWGYPLLLKGIFDIASQLY